MKLRTRNVLLFALSSLIVPVTIHAAAIQVNTTCKVGDCSSAGLQSSALGFGQSIPLTNFSFNYVVGADTYNVSGSYSASFTSSGTSIFATADATYTGTSPSTSSDTLSGNVLQDYYFLNAGSWDGTYSEHIPVSVDPGATFTGDLCYDTTHCLGTIGPLGAGLYDERQTASLTGLTGDYLDASFNFTFMFPQGAAPGTGINVLASVPEPAQTVPVALALFGLGTGWFLRKRSAKA
ncbi:MAG: hypothetical protein JO051_11190 [Acidobacteriaceae bacterium]|nr:hypothetical protein [Acidobacteriaceae bacterium]